MARERLTPKTVDYLVQSVLDSPHVTDSISGLNVRGFADATRETLLAFRFSPRLLGMRIGSYYPDSRRMNYELPEIPDCNPYPIAHLPPHRSNGQTALVDPLFGYTHEIALSALLKTHDTLYRPNPLLKILRDNQARREFDAGKPMGPKSLAREFRRQLLMPSPFELMGESGEGLDLARGLIEASCEEGYKFCLMGIETIAKDGKVVKSQPVLFLPGINHRTRCDGPSDPVRGLEFLESFCKQYEYPRSK